MGRKIAEIALGTDRPTLNSKKKPEHTVMAGISIVSVNAVPFGLLLCRRKQLPLSVRQRQHAREHDIIMRSMLDKYMHIAPPHGTPGCFGDPPSGTTVPTAHGVKGAALEYRV